MSGPVVAAGLCKRRGYSLRFDGHLEPVVEFEIPIVNEERIETPDAHFKSAGVWHTVNRTPLAETMCHCGGRHSRGSHGPPF